MNLYKKEIQRLEIDKAKFAKEQEAVKQQATITLDVLS